MPDPLSPQLADQPIGGQRLIGMQLRGTAAADVDPTTTTRRAAAAAALNQEAAMARAIPTQHPAAAPTSDHAHLRIPLAIAMTAVIGLGVAVVPAGDDGPGTTATPAIGRSQATGTTLAVPPASREPGASSSVCSRPGQRRCTPPSRGAPGAQLRLAPPPAGRP
jgi:hypothetical protein